MKQFLSLRTTTRVNHIAHSPLNVYSATAHGKENKIKAQLSAHIDAMLFAITHHACTGFQ